MNVVCRSTLFQRTVEVALKFAPLIVRVKAAPPATTEAGLMLLRTGTGLVGGLTLNAKAFDAPPPGGGLNTVTLNVPGRAISVAATETIRWVGETKFVGRSAPFHRTVDDVPKFVPVTVMVTPGFPAVSEFGFRLVIAGTAFGG